MDEKGRFRKSLRSDRIVYIGIAALTALLNVAAWNSAAFSDWYIEYVFPIWVGTYGRVTGWFPFSVGEWLIMAGLALLALAAVIGMIWLGTGVAACARQRLGGKQKRESAQGTVYEKGIEQTGKGAGAERRAFGRWRRFSRGFYGFLGWVLAIVCLIMTLNCFILYHASPFSERHFGGDDGEYTLTELIEVYNMVAGECNRLAGVIERDASGMALYQGSIGENGEALDMEDMARELMKRLGEEYPRLKGYYPRPKALVSSDFMCQQHMQGYYFPFSMEANYNDVMHILNFPSTMCHELAHLRGYIYEDEANYIGYLACVKSEDVFFQYAGYLSVLVYLRNDIYRAQKESGTAYAQAAAQIQPMEVEAQVWTDNVFVTQEEWDRINGKALIDTEVVDRAADVFIDANLKVNGVADGSVSYSRVVRLLLQYYRSHEQPHGEKISERY